PSTPSSLSTNQSLRIRCSNSFALLRFGIPVINLPTSCFGVKCGFSSKVSLITTAAKGPTKLLNYLRQ
ncbi:MAG: hypothetical protein MJK14_12710, partial [Rivularia sp. ALOHA_DT_140]|nr:hypothetical protein [Rivularia sp. ALOHA_DT_140]